jgi:hypothetical protein
MHPDGNAQINVLDPGVFFASMIGVSPVPFVAISNPIEALVSYTLGVPLRLAMIDI